MHFNIKEAGFEVDRIHEVGIEIGRNGISIFRTASAYTHAEG